MQLLKRFDAYPKTIEDFREKTLSGAVVSILCAIIVLWLFFSELSFYMTTEVTPTLSVDTGRGEKLRINMDITFEKMPCNFLSLDAMDISGEHQLDISHNIFKKRLRDGRPLGSIERHELPTKEEHVADKADRESKALAQKAGGKKECASCYGAETEEQPCCNTCDQVREAYRRRGWAFSNLKNIQQCVKEGFEEELEKQKGEGCQVYGYLLVNKVAGNFHFAPGRSFQQQHMHVHDFQLFKQKYFNMSHTINSLSFGQVYPGIVNPLDSVSKVSEEEVSAMFQYFVKVVPTRYENLDGRVIATNQFSVTEHTRKLSARASHGLPGVFFMYDLSPIMVRYEETRKSFAHFLTGVCAIIGGVFTVAGIVDSSVYHGYRSLKKKMQLGKAI